MQFSLVLCLGLLMGLCGFAHGAVSKVKQSLLVSYVESRANSLIPEPLLQNRNTIYCAAQGEAAATKIVLHTTGHVDCPVCEAERTAVVSGLGNLTFREASAIWLEQHALYIQPRTLKDYRQYLKPLSEFMGDAKLQDIHIGTVRSYQQWRRQKASNHLVNSEVRSVLKQVMAEAGLWEAIAAHYKTLPVNREGSGKSYTPEQEQAFLDTAFSRKRWMLCGHCFNVAINTGCGFGELRKVKAHEFIDDHEPRILVVEGAKNTERRRPVPLNSSALESMRWIRARWIRLGGSAPDEYLLPMRAKERGGKTCFYEPMTSVKTAFYQIRKAAGLPSEPWKGMRFYDCRPTAITRTLSSGKVSLHTAQKLYGHVSDDMQKRYYKPQIELLREAVTQLEKKPPTKQRLQTGPTLWISSTTY